MPGISNLKRQFDKNISELKYLFPKEIFVPSPIPLHKNGVGTIFSHINIFNNCSPQNVLNAKTIRVHGHRYEVDRLQSIVYNKGMIHLYIFPYFKKRILEKRSIYTSLNFPLFDNIDFQST